MAHNWEYDGPYRYCKNCKKTQTRQPVYLWMRVTHYLWRPLAGKCESPPLTPAGGAETAKKGNAMKKFTKALLNTANEQYDPNFDVPKNEPEVSWVTKVLIDAVIELSAEIDELKHQLEAKQK